MRGQPLLAVLLSAALATSCSAFPGCSAHIEPAGEIADPDREPGEAALKRHVVALAGDIGERNVYRPGTMARSAAYIEAELRTIGYAVRRLPVEVPVLPLHASAAPVTVYNIESVKAGAPPSTDRLP